MPPTNAMRKGDLYGHLVKSTGPCPERAGLEQGTPPGLTPCQQCCIRCSRVTARRDQAGMPWCGGEYPTVEEVA